MTIKIERLMALPLIESMTIKVVRENRNPRDLEIRVGDLISVVGHDPTREAPYSSTRPWPPA